MICNYRRFCYSRGFDRYDRISLYNKSVTIAINKVFITARICWSSIAAFAGSNILASSFRITGQGSMSSNILKQHELVTFRIYIYTVTYGKATKLTLIPPTFKIIVSLVLTFLLCELLYEFLYKVSRNRIPIFPTFHVFIAKVCSFLIFHQLFIIN